MSWAVGENDGRDIGYGVPAICDHPDCTERIDRGLSYVCGGEPPASDSRGCQLFFCEKHLAYFNVRHYGAQMMQLCERCGPRRRKPFAPKPDLPEWLEWKLNHESWGQWRSENPKEVQAIRDILGVPA